MSTKHKLKLIKKSSSPKPIIVVNRPAPKPIKSTPEVKSKKTSKRKSKSH